MEGFYHGVWKQAMNYKKDTGNLVPSSVAVKVSFCLYVPFDLLNKDFPHPF
jgi:hypothetical protein